MYTIVNGKVVLPDRIVEGQALLYTHRIEGLCAAEDIPADAEILDAKGGYILPGLIDLHIHGYAGVDMCDADPEDIQKMSDALLGVGVTGYLATTMTVDVPRLHSAWDACRQAIAYCPNLLGVNAEGPFVSKEKSGAQDPRHAILPNPALMSPYADVIRLTTIAPELPGSIQAVKDLADGGVVVAVGHTDADYDTAKGCLEAGATHATHLFNAMSGLHHRNPGTVEAVLNSPATCELIADNHHVHPALYEPVWRVKGRKLCLVTDCLAAGGMPPGEYALGGTPIVSDGTVCRLKDGTLAGSVSTLLGNVKNVYEATRIPLWECVNCASLNPAAVLGIANRKGSLEPGKDADITIVTPGFAVTTTILGGKIAYTT